MVYKIHVVKWGVKYEDVRVGRPFKFPCLKQGGECKKAEFLTHSEVQKEIDEVDKLIKFSIKLREKIYRKNQVHGFVKGEVDCECGGKATYFVSKNSHISAKCLSCGIEIRE